MKINKHTLLTRDDFREGVFERDNHKCLNCGGPAQDAHHIIERRLFDDGGYYLDNGASVCGDCHYLAESTLLTPQKLRDLAGIKIVVLPMHFDIDQEYDKWGNIVLPDGRVSPGELFYDESVQKVAGPYMNPVLHVKYPRTPHLPWSESSTNSDIETSYGHFVNREIVVTEKLDGENTTMYQDYIHARSIDSPGHESRAWVKQFHAQIQYDIPNDFRVAGENLYARHSILYTDLPSYFVGFGVFDRDTCLGWDDAVDWMELLGITPAPVLYRGVWDEKAVKACFTGESRFGGEQEGYVVRLATRFPIKEFKTSVAKYVRANHIQTVPHNWLRQEIVPNRLTNKS